MHTSVLSPIPQTYGEPKINVTRAFMTLCTTDSYAVGAAVMAQSLKATRTCHPIYCLISKNLSEKSRFLLLNHLDGVLEVDLIESSDLEYLRSSLQRPDLLHALTKLHIWSMDGDPSLSHRVIFSPSPYSKFFLSCSADSQWKKVESSNLLQRMNVIGWSGSIKLDRVVFIDADMLIVQNIDELIDDQLYSNSFAACPDIGWPDHFNSGLMVISPDHRVYLELLLQSTDSIDGADQGLLNVYYSSWSSDSASSTRQKTFRLPFLYNVCFSGSYTYTPAYQYYKNQIKAIHFLGAGNKPWQARYMLRSSISTEQSSIWILPGSININRDMMPYLEKWWDCYSSSNVRKTVEDLDGLGTFGIFSDGPSNVSKKSIDQGNRYSDLVSVGMPAFIQGKDSASFSTASSTSQMASQATLHNYRINWSPEVEKAFPTANALSNSSQMNESISKGFFSPPMVRSILSEEHSSQNSKKIQPNKRVY